MRAAWMVDGGKVEGRILAPDGAVAAVYVSQVTDGVRRWYAGMAGRGTSGPYDSRDAAIDAALLAARKVRA